MAENTPMKRQYNEIKANYPDCLLFFRLGDFYELFDDDAHVASKELDLTLTTRDRGDNISEEDKTPMCGVPYHSVEGYIAKLISRGFKVAICEQMEDPALAKGIVKRDVIRIITPGTVIESSMLDERRSNYICSVFIGEGSGGAVAFCDMSTGEMTCAEFSDNGIQAVMNELGRFEPKEALLSAGASTCFELREFLEKKIFCFSQSMPDIFFPDSAINTFNRFYSGKTIPDIGRESISALCVGALIGYLELTQKCDLSYISEPVLLSEERFMELDWTTRRNLELTDPLRSGNKHATLLAVLDKTLTPMGGRKLRAIVERPLRTVPPIRKRLCAVDELKNNSLLLEDLRETLRGMGDIQRIIARTVYGTANGKDLYALALYIDRLPKLIELLSSVKSTELKNIGGMDSLSDIKESIFSALDENQPFSVREGGMIRPGFNEELDKLRNFRDNSSKMLADLEVRQREITGIKKLKVGYNKVFGYYIDVPKSAGESCIPSDYIRKQTLVSSERYITGELKDLENNIISAAGQINEIEYGIFSALRQSVAEGRERIMSASDAVAMLDTLCSLAYIALKNSYVCPEVDDSGVIDIKNSRHPVVEKLVKDVLFVPNDIYLDKKQPTSVITGPNMAGKSTYMRQAALIVLMAQIGSFVPADSARIGVVDRVFTRIGASDDLSSGMSTFMVEMSETAAILKNATENSLILLDEIGRGTSTFDGMAIAGAVLEYCTRNIGAKTLFATHYHELTAPEVLPKGAVNYSISAKKQDGRLVFLRKIVKGAADESYGIEVGKLAGLPASVIKGSEKRLKELTESSAKPATASVKAKKESESDQISFGDLTEQTLRSKLSNINLDTVTPLEALNILYKLKGEL